MALFSMGPYGALHASANRLMSQSIVVPLSIDIFVIVQPMSFVNTLLFSSSQMSNASRNMLLNPMCGHTSTLDSQEVHHTAMFRLCRRILF